jgi:hypothetical protein
MDEIDGVQGVRSTAEECIVILDEASTTATMQFAILDFFGQALFLCRRSNG